MMKKAKYFSYLFSSVKNNFILTRIKDGWRWFLFWTNRAWISTHIFPSEITTIRIIHAKEIDETFFTFFRSSSHNVVCQPTILKVWRNVVVVVVVANCVDLNDKNKSDKKY